MTSVDAYVEESLHIKSIKHSRLFVRDWVGYPGGDKNVRGLAASIYQHGLLQPIIVRPIEDGFEIVAGHRRFEACRLLHWKHIPAKIRDLSEKDAFEIQLVENIQRMTLNPIEEARAFKKYTTDYGWGGETELARIISRSEQYVSNRIQLLRLPQTIIDEISQNKLKVSHAIEMVNLDETQQKILNDAIVGDNLSVRDIRDITRYSKLHRKEQTKSEMMQHDSYDHYTHMFTSTNLNVNNESIRQQISLLKRAQLCLKVSLYRLDSLINESNEKLSSTKKLAVNDILMQFRLKIHSMMDENLKAIAKLNKELR